MHSTPTSPPALSPDKTRISIVSLMLVTMMACSSILLSCRTSFKYIAGTQQGINYQHQRLKLSVNKTSVPTKGNPGSILVLNANCNIDGERVITWDLGDGSDLQYGSRIRYSYIYANSYTVTVRCENKNKDVAEQKVTIQVIYQNPHTRSPAPSSTSPSVNTPAEN